MAVLRRIIKGRVKIGNFTSYLASQTCWIEALNGPTGVGVSVTTISEVEDVLAVTGNQVLTGLHGTS